MIKKKGGGLFLAKFKVGLQIDKKGYMSLYCECDDVSGDKDVVKVFELAELVKSQRHKLIQTFQSKK